MSPRRGRKKIKGVSLNKIHVSKKGSVPLRNPRRQCRPHLGHRLGAEGFIFPTQCSQSEASGPRALPALQAAPRVQVQGKAQGQEVTGTSQRPLPTSNETKGTSTLSTADWIMEGCHCRHDFCWFIFWYINDILKPEAGRKIKYSKNIGLLEKRKRVKIKSEEIQRGQGSLPQRALLHHLEHTCPKRSLPHTQ